MSIAKRLKELREKSGLTLREVEEATGIVNKTIHNYESGLTANPKRKILEKLASFYKVDLNFILFGKTINEEDDRINKMPPRIILVSENKKQTKIALVPISAQAGYLQRYDDENYIRTLPLFDIPGFTNGNFRMFTVEGDSMETTLKSGDIVVCEHVEHFSEIKDNNIYVIVSTEGIVVKKVVNNIEKNRALIIKSDNPAYEPDFIPIDKVLEIWKYKRRFTD